MVVYPNSSSGLFPLFMEIIMKITALVAAAALATVSTAAFAESADVTTQSGEVVMVEKNQAGSLPFLTGLGGASIFVPIAFVGAIAAIDAAGGS